MIDRATIEAATRQLLQGLGVPKDDHNFDDTPSRVARAYQEIFSPPDTEWPVFEESYTDMVLLRGHTLWTLCPHHLLPVRMKVSIAYFPNGKVIGASKLARLLHDCNRYPMTQEAFTAEVAKAMERLTGGTSSGEAVFIEGHHGCMEIRGIRSSATLITTKFTGRFSVNEDLQRRFHDLVSL